MVAAAVAAADATAEEAALSLMPPLQVPWRRCVQFINYKESCSGLLVVDVFVFIFIKTDTGFVAFS